MTELTDLSETDASNTTITSIDIDEGCAPSGINNAIRNTLGLIRRAFKSTIFRLRDSTDQTKLLAFDLSGFTTGTTRTVTFPDQNLTIGALAGKDDIQTSDLDGSFVLPVANGGTAATTASAARTALGAAAIDAGYNAIGSYTLAKSVNVRASGATESGANLNACALDGAGVFAANGTALTGTWRNVGGGVDATYFISLWQRIS